MSTYTVNGVTFTARHESNELKHHGVKGMKWGRRKARPEPVGNGHRGGRAITDSPEAQAAAKEARQQKAKRAAKIGAAVVAAGLTVYGAKKLHDVVRGKNERIYVERGRKEVEKMLTRGVYMDKARLDKVYASLMSNVRYDARQSAASDSFRGAAKNVANYYLDKYRR